MAMLNVHMNIGLSNIALSALGVALQANDWIIYSWLYRMMTSHEERGNKGKVTNIKL